LIAANAAGRQARALAGSAGRIAGNPAEQGKRPMKVYAVLRGDHGGELDRQTIEIRSEQDQSAVIRNALIRMVGEWILNPGDTITIEESDL
jgi:hypothetical protein